MRPCPVALALLLLLVAGASGPEAKGDELAEFRTVETAIGAKFAKDARAPAGAQPGYLGVQLALGPSSETAPVLSGKSAPLEALELVYRAQRARWRSSARRANAE